MSFFLYHGFEPLTLYNKESAGLDRSRPTIFAHARSAAPVFYPLGPLRFALIDFWDISQYCVHEGYCGGHRRLRSTVFF